jgi:DNA-binding NarL/FixJ family response regulator
MTTAALTRDQVALRPAGSERKPPPRALGHMILVEPRALFRECLTDRLNQSGDESAVTAYASLTELEFPYEKADSVLALLLSVPPGDRSVSDIAEAVSLARGQLPQAPIVVIAECEELAFVRNVMSLGVQGYIPTSFDFTTFKEAIGFIQAGGTFVPASALLDFEHQWPAGREHRHFKGSSLFAQDRPGHEGPGRMSAVNFTRRELDVVGELRKGKSNKLIARELSIGEGTVKLHVQRIMRKLHVNNRTQAALILEETLALTESN